MVLALLVTHRGWSRAHFISNPCRETGRMRDQPRPFSAPNFYLIVAFFFFNGRGIAHAETASGMVAMALRLSVLMTMTAPFSSVPAVPVDLPRAKSRVEGQICPGCRGR